MAVSPSSDAGAQPLVDLAVQTTGNTHIYDAVSAYIATPQLLTYLGIGASTIPRDAEVLTTNQKAPIIVTAQRTQDTPINAVIARPRYSSLPHAFVTESALKNFGLQTTLVGWVVQSPQPLTVAELDATRHIAVGAGFTIEARHGPTTHRTVRTVAAIAGALFALAIVAMTVGTLRSEAADELRTLTATGANGSIRRSLTAATATALAAAGVVLGTLGAYLGLALSTAPRWAVFVRPPTASSVVSNVAVPPRPFTRSTDQGR